jgi:predicted MFS family arabinose efflux permease
LASGFSLGNILAPALGGWVAEQWGLRAVFWCALGVWTLSTLAVLLLRDLPVPPRTAAAHPRHLATDRRFAWQVLVFFVVFFALNLGVVLLPNYLQDVKDLSLEQIGQLGSLSALGMFLFMLVLGNLRSGRRSPLLLNQLAIAAALVCCLAAPAGHLQPLLLLGMFCRGADQAMWPLTRGRLSLMLPPQVLSLGFGVLDTATQLALTLSPVVAGQLYARGPAWPLYAGLALLAGAMLLTLSLRPAARPQPAEAALPQAP